MSGPPDSIADEFFEPLPPLPKTEVCRHLRIHTEKSLEGNFAILRTRCLDCGRVFQEDRSLQGLTPQRCPLDPRLDRCLTGCAVEDGSADIFEHPCLPVMKAAEEAGLRGEMRSPEANS
ncbi:MAG TPA: hypothetical protein VMS77_07890 [Conexivisphaerales archaeon]|nr:hypothetical protein [Conexivisphaerales archaeon]